MYKKLIADDIPHQYPQTIGLNETSSSILTEEVVRVINLQKKGKAVGPEEIYAEVLKLLVQMKGTYLKLLATLFNTKYTVGKILSD